MSDLECLYGCVVGKKLSITLRDDKSVLEPFVDVHEAAFQPQDKMLGYFEFMMNIKNMTLYSKQVFRLIMKTSNIFRSTPLPTRTPFHKLSFPHYHLIHTAISHTTIFLHRELREVANYTSLHTKIVPQNEQRYITDSSPARKNLGCISNGWWRHQTAFGSPNAPTR